MQCSDPRRGSLCLPAGPEGWRLVLVPLALMLGVAAGRWFYFVFGEAAEAVTVGVTAADVAVQLVELVLTAAAAGSVGTDAAMQPLAAGRMSPVIPLITAAAMGSATGWSFYLAFTEAAEAVAVGVTMTSVALRVVETLISPVRVVVVSCARALVTKMNELADTVRDFINRFFSGFGGAAPCAVRAA
ncbi:hypothetical protein J7E87_32265 [Streptomyces sp. ISL-1]|uniref:hypothetical protein n=1 Tax=Streptomyces sp. ISL-1 TaxID=2817657 RepID=UPI001BEA1598|nr:hypothetical protein [Streptomyces sp. ISL-1]MBT2393961.1 hypothetical protein [Streptomyces sp. ISL-1]